MPRDYYPDHFLLRLPEGMLDRMRGVLREGEKLGQVAREAFATELNARQVSLVLSSRDKSAVVNGLPCPACNGELGCGHSAQDKIDLISRLPNPQKWLSERLAGPSDPASASATEAVERCYDQASRPINLDDLP